MCTFAISLKKTMKTKRIEKLRNSKPIEITGNEITPSEDLKKYKKNALEYGKSLRGTYTNQDTGAKISFAVKGIKEVLEHDYKDVGHLQSVVAIPQIIEKSIFIDREDNEDKSKNDDVVNYDYYAAGLKINSVDYTVKAVVANGMNGMRYYDHKLTPIAKEKLLDELDRITNPSSQKGVFENSVVSSGLSSTSGS